MTFTCTEQHTHRETLQLYNQRAKRPYCFGIMSNLFTSIEKGEKSLCRDLEHKIKKSVTEIAVMAFSTKLGNIIMETLLSSVYETMLHALAFAYLFSITPQFQEYTKISN